MRVIVIGAGPAGLTAAYLLSKKKVSVTVYEADPRYVGGISRTVQYKGYHFDIGGHRFFSKSQEVEDLWSELLPSDLLVRPRSSRIYYRGKFFSYPLRAFEALSRLGLIEATRCMLSYFQYRLFPIKNPRSFEEWVTNQFGSRLFQIFFKTYTEKVWGMSCKEISADWAAQRIKGLSLGSAIWNALKPKRKPKDRKKVIKTLIDSFRYPRKGPGMMWESCQKKIEAFGGQVTLGTKVVGCEYIPNQKVWRVSLRGPEGKIFQQESEYVISSAPIRDLVRGLQPKVSKGVELSAESLKYRDFLTIALIVKADEAFQDNWVYIHDPNVKVGRVQNFRAWSPEMVPDRETNCYGLEYFCFEGDELWNASDQSLIELAKKELCEIGIARWDQIVDGCVVRMKKSYPVYDEHYSEHVDTIREELEKNYPNLFLVGRNGMHKYNNQDHAMMTAMLCVENILSGKKLYDLWKVNQDAEYHEEGSAGSSSASGLRMVPKRLEPSP